MQKTVAQGPRLPKHSLGLLKHNDQLNTASSQSSYVLLANHIHHPETLWWPKYKSGLPKHNDQLNTSSQSSSSCNKVWGCQNRNPASMKHNDQLGQNIRMEHNGARTPKNFSIVDRNTVWGCQSRIKAYTPPQD